MPHIEAGLALVRMTFDDLQDAAGYVCTKRDFESANGDDEDEEEDEEEEEEKKKEKDEEDEDDDDDDDGANECLSRQAGKIEQHIAGLKRTRQLAELSRRDGKAPRQRWVSQRAPAKAPLAQELRSWRRLTDRMTEIGRLQHLKSAARKAVHSLLR